jgi:hypothetical protein
MGESRTEDDKGTNPSDDEAPVTKIKKQPVDESSYSLLTETIFSFPPFGAKILR